MQHRTIALTPRPATRSRHPGARRAGGFTLVEILVVIALLALLGAIAFVGYTAVTRQGLTNKTRMQLSNASSLLAEYDAKTKLRRQPPHAWTDVTMPPTYFEPSPPFNFWRDFDPAPPTTPDPNDEHEGLPAPGNVEAGDETRDRTFQTPRTGSAAVLNTQVVLYLAAQLPANRTLLGNMGADQLMRMQEDLANSPDFDERQHPILLDAWDNPIIFVPASGLRGVYLGDPAEEFVITSAKVYSATELPDGIVAPNARPFFASAGPDGIFSFRDANSSGTFEAGSDPGAGDDNLYSFESK